MTDAFTPPTPTVRPWLRRLAPLPLTVFRSAGWLLGAVLYLGAARRRRIVAQNLALCFPDTPVATRRRWTWDTFKHFGQTFVDRVWLWHGAPDITRSRVTLHGLEHLPTGGVLCFAPHFFGLDAAWSRLTLDSERPWWTLYMPQAHDGMDAWVEVGRQRHASAHLVARHEGMRPLLKALRAGAAVYLLPDMDLGADHSVFVPFFGVTAATVPTLARMAQSARVPVVPVVTRLVSGGYQVEVLPPWTGYPSGDDMADARQMNQQLEAWIRTMPGQYHWLHRRFKTRPPGEPTLYRDGV